jgi:hypothetical protein
MVLACSLTALFLHDRFAKVCDGSVVTLHIDQPGESDFRSGFATGSTHSNYLPVRISRVSAAGRAKIGDQQLVSISVA